ncbi:MAG: hypothetical protein AAF492_24565, partial [Verrucomicrobiota bacterium]
MYTKSLVLFGLLASLAVGTVVAKNENDSVQMIPIPKRDSGYMNFESTIIKTQEDLDAFLKRKNDDWEVRAAFDKAIARAKLNFDEQALVLLRHTEDSGSNKVTFHKPQIVEKQLACKITRKVPGLGTDDGAYYCFALAVSKEAITEVALDAPGR